MREVAGSNPSAPTKAPFAKANGIFIYHFLLLHYYLKAERASVTDGGAPPELLAAGAVSRRLFHIISIWHIFMVVIAALWLSGVTPAQHEASTAMPVSG